MISAAHDEFEGGGRIAIWESPTLEPEPITRVEEFQVGLLKLTHQTTGPMVPGMDGFSIPTEAGVGSGYAACRDRL